MLHPHGVREAVIMQSSALRNTMKSTDIHSRWFMLTNGTNDLEELLKWSLIQLL